MNDNWSRFAARNAWWLSGVAVVATFDLLMVLSSFWPRLFRYDEGMTVIEALIFWNVGLQLIVWPCSGLLFLVLKGTSTWRRVRLFALGTMQTLLYSFLSLEEIRGVLSYTSYKFPIVIDNLVVSGLLVLWSLSLIFAALVWKP